MPPKPANKAKSENVSCNVDKQLLDTLIQSLHALRGYQDTEQQSNGVAESAKDLPTRLDPTNLNDILHHILTAVNDLTASVHATQRECQRRTETQGKELRNLEKRMRISEDEQDECRQRSLKGNFIISSVADNSKQRVSLIKSDDQLAEDEETLTQHVIALAKKKYNVAIDAEEIQACHRLPNNQVILRLWKRTPGSSWSRLVAGIKSGMNAGYNVYFNFQLTRRRINLVYELRQLRKNKSIQKFFTDENGQISVIIREGGNKHRLTYISTGRGSVPHRPAALVLLTCGSLLVLRRTFTFF